jgi:thiamine pyrophosphokinase
MNTSRRVCIIANSRVFNDLCVATRWKESDLIIATDGAANRLPEGFNPHIICGDFDSIDKAAARKRFPTAELVCSPCQETNDLEKSIRLAIERGASEIAVSCSMGGRLDHTVTTLSLLEAYHRQVSIVLYDHDRTCRVFSAQDAHEAVFQLAAHEGDTVSLVPRADGAMVSLSNVQWPLTRERLTPGSRGVSNRAVGSVVTLTVQQGLVFLFHSPGE